MFFVTRPTADDIRAVLSIHQRSPFSYVELGASREATPAGYRILNREILLGCGSQKFSRASEALYQWRMFDVPGVQLCWPNVSIQVGNVVGVLLKHFGFWSLNFCRIVYLIDEEKPIRRVGFAYGTLINHAEIGEERFTVQWDQATDQVTYEIFSFSKPGHWITRIANPLARSLQERFVAYSLAAMARATEHQ